MSQFEEIDGKEYVESVTNAQKNLDDTELHEYECETCGVKVNLTESEAFQAGWDYPPFLGKWNVLSPRTCGNCLLDTTAYWAFITERPKQIEDMDERHQATIKRIVAEKERGA